MGIMVQEKLRAAIQNSRKPELSGVLVIDKPAGMTSHDVVNRVRRTLGQRSVGHLGTLDPLATGVLPLVVGHCTRLAQFYTKSEKSYEGVIRFGFETDTYDAEGERTSEVAEVNVTLEELQRWATTFEGAIEQIPPPFSAKKIAGTPAYKLARKNKDVELRPVTVEIKQFEIKELHNVRASFYARVGSGTYMRSAAHDLGRQLGCGAHLESLRRTSAAEFDLSDAHTLDGAELLARSENFDDLFVHPRRLLPHMPAVTANEEMAAKIAYGRSVNLPELSNAKLVKVFCGQRELIAIATRVAGTLFHPGIVLTGRSNSAALVST
jgi:tRNA pseudouridine55 synthase